MMLVTERAVTLVTYLKPVTVVQTRAVRWTHHIAKLDFVDSFAGIHVDWEADFQEPMKFMPVYLSFEIDSSAVRNKLDILFKNRVHDAALYMQHSTETSRFLHGDLYWILHSYWLQDIVGINIPGIKCAWYILVSKEPVHSPSGKLPAG